jgi:hypothetical protein
LTTAALAATLTSTPTLTVTLAGSATAPGLVRKRNATLTSTFFHLLVIFFARALAFLSGGQGTHFLATLLSLFRCHEITPANSTAIPRAGTMATRSSRPSQFGKLDALFFRPCAHLLLMPRTHRGTFFLRPERAHRNAVLITLLLRHQLRPHDRDLPFPLRVLFLCECSGRRDQQ